MKNIVVLLAMSGAALACAAQDEEGAAAASARIKADRAQVESIFRADEKACYGKFAVNDCLNEARARRRQALADLRRQEVSLNDAERRRRAAERLRDLDERAANKPPQQPQPHGGTAVQRERRAPNPSHKEAERAERAQAQQARAAKAQSRSKQAQQKRADASAQRASKAAGTQRSLERHEQRLKHAEQRQEKLAQRLAARKKPAGEPLPVPP